MVNLVDMNVIPPAMVKAMTEYDLTLNDIDKMDFTEFSEFCAQLDLDCLKCLHGRVKNPRWEAHIWRIMDNAAFIRNRC